MKFLRTLLVAALLVISAQALFASDADLAFSATNTSVQEGGTTSVTVVLDAEPSTNTTFAVARSEGGLLVSVSPASFVFTTATYSTSQTLTFTGLTDLYDYSTGDTTFTVTASAGDTTITTGAVCVTYVSDGEFLGDNTCLTSYTLTYSTQNLDQITTPSAGVVATFKFVGKQSPKRWFKVWNLDATSVADVFYGDVTGEIVANFGGDVEISAGGSYAVTEETGLMPSSGISAFSMCLDDGTTPTFKVRVR